MIKNLLHHKRGQHAVVLDDHEMFASAFGMLLESYDLFSFVHIFSKEEDLTEHLIHNRTSQVTYLFLDYYLGERTLASFINTIKRFGRKIRIIIVSGATNPVLIKSLLDFKPDGIIHKSDSTHHVTECVQFIEQGKSYFSPYIRNILERETALDSLQILTTREIEILEYFAKGLTVDETAKAVNLSRHTVAAHRRKMFSKTNCNSITELLGYARKIELI